MEENLPKLDTLIMTNNNIQGGSYSGVKKIQNTQNGEWAKRDSYYLSFVQNIAIQPIQYLFIDFTPEDPPQNQELADIETLSSVKTLTMLSLLHNPVVAKPNYRLFVIHRFPNLRVLDFKKVKVRCWINLVIALE